jgi:glycosyltransferase involved in cell wall biosynthesis
VNRDKTISVAICTYNRAGRLYELIEAVRKQVCQIPYEILVIDNNSSDDTMVVLKKLAMSDGAPLRFVREERQGIVHARNRAVEEAKKSTYMAFIDDDEIPCDGWLKAAVDALDRENAECVGGEIRVSLPCKECPEWLGQELLGFLGEVKYDIQPFWITDSTTSLWCGNIAYRMSLFADGLRFDQRYNRKGIGVGGSEDGAMFKSMLEQGARMRYRPDMVIEHFVDEWKIKRSYFLKLHYTAGKRLGWLGSEDYGNTVFGVPPFMVAQLIKQCGRACIMFLRGKQGLMRQMMNVTYAFGMIGGRFKNWKNK